MVEEKWIMAKVGAGAPPHGQRPWRDVVPALRDDPAALLLSTDVFHLTKFD